MNFWQKSIRFAYKDLQEFQKWSDDEIWLNVKAEMIKNSNGDLGPDDLDWIKAIVTYKKDATLLEVQRMIDLVYHLYLMVNTKFISLHTHNQKN